MKPLEIGKRYGRLTVIAEGERRVCPSGKSRRVAKCQCDCGEIIGVSIWSLNSKTKPTLSCGCLTIEMMKITKTKHGLINHPLYRKLMGMKKRCYNPKYGQYHRYGGRGIKVCEEWLNDFMSFYNWAMANGWEDGLEIDRKDNDGNYEPSNCRFVTSQENTHNRRTSKLNWEDVHNIRNAKLLNPETKNTELAKTFEVSRRTINNILNNERWREAV